MQKINNLNLAPVTNEVSCVFCMAKIPRAEATIGVCHLYACSTHLNRGEEHKWFRVWAHFMTSRAMTLDRIEEVEG